MKKIAKSIPLLLGVFLFCVCSSVSAQTFLPPNLWDTTPPITACDNDSSGTPRDFPIEIEFSGTLFGSNNTFIIQMSDENGNFEDGSGNFIGVELRTVNDPNNIFKVPASFQLPEGTFGKNYKIRIKSSDPEMISPESPVFEAYYNQLTTGSFGITNIEGTNDREVFLCGSDSAEVKLTIDRVGDYLWYREVTGDDILVGTTQEPNFTITQAGKYYAVIDYSGCGSVESRRIDAIGVGVSDVKIKGNSVVEICGDQSHTFELDIVNSSYGYQWFKDGEAIAGATSSTYTTPTSGQFGIYTLQATAGTCVVPSSEVELKAQGAANFNITENGSLTRILIPGFREELSIDYDTATGRTVQWYNENGPIASNTGSLMFANTPGCYFARVEEPSSGSCNLVDDSEKFCVSIATDFEVAIRVEDPNYEDCLFSTANLVLVGIDAMDVDGNKRSVTSEELNANPAIFEYQWFKDGVALVGETNNSLSLDSYLDNGDYYLQVKAINLTSTEPTDKLTVKLMIEDPTITSVPDSNSLCPNTGGITYTIEGGLEPNHTYEWFKDSDATPIATNVIDIVVDEVGEYTLKITGPGCEKKIDPIGVVLFDDSVVTVTPSEIVVLNQSGTVTVTADGAESYVWHLGEGTSGAILSTNETLNVSNLGFYTVVATVGNCAVEKTIEVVEQDDQVIVPNVVTPNGDGKNDTWKISNRYAFQPSVTIIIYNSEGKELINSTDYKNDWPIEDVNNQRVFYYKIIRDDKTLKAGTISVLH